MTQDWLDNVAQEICYDAKLIRYDGTGGFVAEEKSMAIVKAAFARFSPFRDGVAYMPVPRCDGCRHWGQPTGTVGVCTVLSRPLEKSGKVYTTPGDFGCVKFEGKP